MIAGVWQFKDKKVIAFSATSSLPYVRFISKCFGQPLVLNFQSEYEVNH
jgi:hypothetical protein